MQRTGIYVRLSKDDGNQEVSKSIQNQIDFCVDFALNNNFNIFKIYSDEGYSGKDFNRPEFEKMILDIQSGLIKTVIVKDLSRLGRNLVQVGHFVEEFFPLLGVRFVSILDNYDSFSSDDDNFVLKAFANDFYLRNCRKKMNFIYDFRSKKEYISNYCLYGYLHDKKKKVVINPDTYKNVVFIYESYLNGLSPQKIGKLLEEKKILNPTAYKRSIGIGRKAYAKNPYGWSKGTIEKMLKELEYTGVAINMNFSKRNVEKVMIENTHPAIIDRSLFEAVQQKTKSRNANISVDFNALDKIRLKGIVKCNCCGHSMRYEKRKNSKLMYRCLKCGISFELKKIHQIIYKDIEVLINSINNDSKEFKKQILSSYKSNKIQVYKDNISKQIDDTENKIEKVFEHYISNTLSSNDYLTKTNELKEKLEFLKVQHEQNPINLTQGTYADLVDRFIELCKNNKNKDLNIIRALIHAIYVGHNNGNLNITPIYKFNPTIIKVEEQNISIAKNSNKQKMILDLIKENKIITLNEIADRLNINKKTAWRIIDELKDKKILSRDGSAKTGIWRIVKEVSMQ